MLVITSRGEFVRGGDAALRQITLSTCFVTEFFYQSLAENL